jgi:hypothetical protein
MAKKLICPHCGAEVNPGIMDCPFCHQSMFLSMNQIKAKEAANNDANHVVTQDEYIAQQQKAQYQQQLNPSINQPAQQPVQQPVMQQQVMYDPNTGQPIQQPIQQVPIQTLVDPNTGQQVQGYYDPYTGQWVTLQQTIQPQKQGESQGVLYIALGLEVLGFLIGGGFIFGIVALLLANSYKDSNGLKTVVKVIAYLNIVVGLVAIVLLFLLLSSK